MSLLMPRSIFIPASIVEGSLSAESLGAIAWIVAQNLQRVRPSDLKTRFKWGEVIWRRVSRELRAHKFLNTHRTKDGTEIHFNLKANY
jgi:hypothetical protein